jgi:preprotein translocase subunit SecA
VAGMREEAVGGLIDQFVPHQTAPADWDLDALNAALLRDFNVSVDAKGWVAENPEIEENTFRARVVQAVDDAYASKVERFGAPLMRQVERDFVLRNLDSHWREHLAAMDYLRQGIHLRGYAQKDYRYEFKREAFELFTAMLGRVKFETASMLAKVEVRDEAQAEREEAEQRERLMRALQAQHAEAQSLLTAEGAAQLGAEETVDGAPLVAQEQRAAPAPFVRGVPKVGRNDACPCGSGKKYKQCHGQLA